MKYENYIAKVTCYNCRRMMRIKIPVGVEIASHPCPKCGTKELVSGYVKWKG